MFPSTPFRFSIQAFSKIVPALVPVLIFSMLLFTFGCAGSSYSRLNFLVPVVNISQGVIATDGVTIQAADGSFSLESRQSFHTPFQVDGYNLWVTTQEQRNRPADLTGRALNALEIGAVRVIVTTPYLDKPLFGVLLLSKVPAKATGPGARSYYIQVPESYVREATGGRTSVVYERVQIEGIGEGFNWALWMSDVDFPPLPGGKDMLPSAERERLAFLNFDQIMTQRMQTRAEMGSGDDTDFGSVLLYILLLGGLVYLLAVAAEQEE